MSTIQKEIADSIEAHLKATLPEDVFAATVNDKEETIEDARKREAGKLQSKLEKEKTELVSIYENAQSVSHFYNGVSADVQSIKADKPSMHHVLANQGSYLATELGKLEKKGAATLGDTLIACSKHASTLSGNFNGISVLLNSLSGDMVTQSNNKGTAGDYAYDQMMKHLEKLDNEAAKTSDREIKPEDTLVYRFKAFNPTNVNENLLALRNTVEDYYKSIVDITIKYQNVIPRLDQLKSLQTRIAAAVTSLEADLSAKTEASIAKAYEELASLHAKKEELLQLRLSCGSLLPQPALAVSDKSAAGGENGADKSVKTDGDNNAATAGSGEKESQNGNSSKEGKEDNISVDDPLEAVNNSIMEANKVLNTNKDLKEKYNEFITKIKAVLGIKEAYNSKLDEHLVALAETKNVGADLKEIMEELKSLLAGLVDCLNVLYLGNVMGGEFSEDPKISDKKKAAELEKAVKDAKTADSITTNFIKAIKGIKATKSDKGKKNEPGLDAIHEMIVTLNEGISKAEANSDIKEYFGSIVTKMETFPESVKNVISNALLIEHTIKDLYTWAGTVDKNLGASLVEDYKASSLNFVKISNKDEVFSGPQIEDLIEDLKGKKLKDIDLEFPDGSNPLASWTTEHKASFFGNAEKMTEWQAFFEEELVRFETEDAIQASKIEFLNKLRPEEVKAA